jgi:hypothetical protein
VTPPRGRVFRFWHSERWLLFFVVLLVAAVFDQSYVGRHELVNSQRRGCQRGILDRQDTIRVRRTQALSDAAIGHDPAQPPATRRVRLHQAAIEWRSVHALQSRIPPALDCARAFPQPSPFPHFG